MNRKFLLAVVAGTVTLFIVGFILYGVVLLEFFQRNTAMEGLMKEEVTGSGFGLVLLGELVLATILTMIISRWGRDHTFMTGLKTGAIVGFGLAGGAIGAVLGGRSNEP